MTRCTTAFRALVALALLLPALAAGQADERDSSRAVIGSKAFTESVILGEMMTGLLESEGIPATHWREHTTLWLTLQRRFIYVQGCVAPGFDKQAFVSELTKTADVERVIDQMTTDPASPALPYRTQADPDKPASMPDGG